MSCSLGLNRTMIMVIVLLSAFHNLLVLSGSIYMMLIYDMVIPSGNGASLVGLLLILLVAYAFQSGFELLRSSMLRRIGRGVFEAYSERAFLRVQEMKDEEPANDLERIRAYLSGPGPGALVDLPWTALYLLVLFLLHVWLGVVASIGVIVLTALAFMNDHRMKEPTEEGGMIAKERQAFLRETRLQSGPLSSLGMIPRMSSIWQERTSRHLDTQQHLAAVGGNLTGISKTFRMLLQSLILTVGALLVIDGQATGGIIIAGSIIGSRALAPIEAAISTWKPMKAAREAWTRTRALPDEVEAKMELPAPAEMLEVQGLEVTVEGRKDPILADIGLTLEKGQIVAIVGPSAAGKTTLLRALAGQIPEAHTTTRLDGASYDQWDIDRLGRHLGYLPQDPMFLTGTVSQNISRFDEDADAERITRAAKAAGVHDMILRMPDGYNARMSPIGPEQSGGQRQRIGLARAFYGDPFLILLDEPNSNLDGEGELSLGNALVEQAARGAIVIAASHRPAMLQVATHILVLAGGRIQAFGEREKIMPKLMKGRSA